MASSGGGGGAIPDADGPSFASSAARLGAVVRVKRRVDETPMEALRFAKRRRTEGCQQKQQQPQQGHHNKENAPTGTTDKAEEQPELVLTFVGTADKPDLHSVQSVIRRHHEVALKKEADSPQRTLEARRRKLQIVEDHHKLMKRTQEEAASQQHDEVEECVGNKKHKPENSQTTSDESEQHQLFRVFDALHEDIVEPSKPGAAECVKKPAVLVEPVACNGVPMMVLSVTKQLTLATNKQDKAVAPLAQTEDDDFVYDIYYTTTEQHEAQQLPTEGHEFVLEKFCLPQEKIMFDGEFRDDPLLADDDADSNAEDNPQNDYPDEEDWYDDNGRERKWDPEGFGEEFEEYDEMGYLEHRMRVFDFEQSGAKDSEDEDDYNEPGYGRQTGYYGDAYDLNEF